MTNGLINELLSDYCLLEILSYLSITDLRDAPKVCRRWDALWPRLWKNVNRLNCSEYMWSFEQKNFYESHVVTSINELKEILRFCGPFIKFFHLDVHDNDFVELTALTSTVIDHCKYLEDVSITMLESPPIFRIDKILENSSNLKRLAITNMNHKVEENLSMLRINNINLKGFSLVKVSSRNVSGKFFEYLPDDLEELRLIDCFNNTDPSYAVCALMRFNNLRSFECEECTWFQDSLAKIICNKKKLHKLSIPSTFRLSSSFNGLVDLVNLTVLCLDRNSELEDGNLINIVNSCKQIEELHLNSCSSLTNFGIASIAVLPKLKLLEIAQLKNITDEPIGDLPNTLEYLFCEECELVKDPGLVILVERATKLKQLCIRACPGVTNDLIEASVVATRLRTIDVKLTIFASGTLVDLSSIRTRIPPLLLVHCY